MALLRLNIFSESLGRNVPVNVILPQNTARFPSVCRPPLPTLYLLHGLSDDQDSWLRWTSVERYAQSRRLAVVMPSTDRGFYTDTVYGAKYFSYISEELPRVLSQWFPLSERREDTYAAGLSMGGYGALKLGLRLPERFGAVASLSAAPMSGDMQKFRAAQKADDPLAHEFSYVFGNVILPDDDIFVLAGSAAQMPQAPKIYLCCGESDYLFPLNEMLYGEMTRSGLDVTYSSEPGVSHEWGYWDRKILDVLDWLPVQE